MKVDSYPRESLNQGPCVFERVHGRYATLSVRQSGTHDGLANANPHDFARDDERASRTPAPRELSCLSLASAEAGFAQHHRGGSPAALKRSSRLIGGPKRASVGYSQTSDRGAGCLSTGLHACYGWCSAHGSDFLCTGALRSGRVTPSSSRLRIMLSSSMPPPR